MLVLKDNIVADYRSIFANTSFPPNGPSDEFLAEQGAYKVNLWRPYDSATEKLVSCAPYIQDGWAYTVTVEPKTAEELAADLEAKAASVRADRNRRLADCDWTQLPDAPVDAAAWAAYRQELRDVTAQAGFPSDVVWPVQPEG